MNPAIIPACLAALVLGACASQPDVQIPKPDATGRLALADADMRTAISPSPDGSLWSAEPTSLLAMRRAKEVGDLLTVVVELDDQARLQSSLTSTRESSESLDIRALLGLPEWADGVLPGGSSLAPAIDLERSSSLDGNGAVNRLDQIEFRLAARVVGVEPNGNLVVEGYQEIRVGFETRYLMVSGVIRAQDITRTNTVDYDKIAEAQLSYVSTGDTLGSQRRRAIPKLIDRVLPF